MNLLYYGLACDEAYLDERLKKTQAPYIIAQQMFEVAMLEQLQKDSEIDLMSNYIPQQPSFPKSKCLFVPARKRVIKDSIPIRYLSCLNFPLVKFIWLFFSSFFRTLNFGLRTRDKHSRVILSSVNYFPVALGNYWASKIVRIPRVCIFTDSTEFTAQEERISRMPFLKRKLVKSYLNMMRRMEERYDGYILFSKHMNDVINRKDKPFIVMEGIFNPQGLDFTKRKKRCV